MSTIRSVRSYTTLSRLVTTLRDDLDNGGNDFLLIYAYNGTGETRLSMAFKDKWKTTRQGDRARGRDTLYFNAFTEDLFR